LTETSWRIYQPEFAADALVPEYQVWPWHGHRLFAYDLLAFLRPKLFVELGTYWGTSFFAFCQAVRDFNLSTRCVAVDTWEGDDHTGKYDGSVFEMVEKVQKAFFPSLAIELKRSLFADALPLFASESIDLLHIDGFHSYEAASGDFTSWLPKLAENGVVLFHDIADDCGYGSARYWQELSQQFPGFSFQHSWGLGVLFPKGDAHYRRMQANGINEKLKIYQEISEYRLLKIQKAASDERGDRQHALITAQEGRIAELERELATARESLTRIQAHPLVKIADRFGLKLS